jgi:ABC-type branched-subunit amino acid transport system substrate-binding protein
MHRAKVRRVVPGVLCAAAVGLAACGSSSSGGSAGSATGAGASGSTGSSVTLAASSGGGNPITIGILADLTGATKTIGNQFINGSIAAAKVFGPVDGRPVKFIVGQGQEFSAAAAAAKVLELKERDAVSAVLGFASSECEGAISVAKRVQIPMIGNSCSIQDVVGHGCSYWFVNGGQNPAEAAQGFAASASKQFPGLVGEKWVVAGDDPGWSQSIAQYWDAIPGASHAAVEVAPFGTTDWAPYLAKIKATGARALLLAVSWGSQYVAFLQQAHAAGLFKQMAIVAPNGFPENSMVPGYGEPADAATIAALLQTKILTQYGGSWTYLEQNPLGRAFVDTFYKMYGYPPTTQANVAMVDTWMLLSAMKAAGTDPKSVMAKLTSGSFQTPYYAQPLRVQPGGRQLEIPMFATKFVKLAAPEFGVQYANKVLFAIPGSQAVASAATYGCHPTS